MSIIRRTHIHELRAISLVFVWSFVLKPRQLTLLSARPLQTAPKKFTCTVMFMLAGLFLICFVFAGCHASKQGRGNKLERTKRRKVPKGWTRKTNLFGNSFMEGVSVGVVAVRPSEAWRSRAGGNPVTCDNPLDGTPRLTVRPRPPRLGYFDARSHVATSAGRAGESNDSAVRVASMTARPASSWYSARVSCRALAGTVMGGPK